MTQVIYSKNNSQGTKLCPGTSIYEILAQAQAICNTQANIYVSANLNKTQMRTINLKMSKYRKYEHECKKAILSHCLPIYFFIISK